MKLKNALVAVAIMGVLMSPVAAQAGTPSAAAAGKIVKVSDMGARKSTAVRGKQKADAGVVVIALLGAGAAGFGVYKAVDDDKSNGS